MAAQTVSQSSEGNSTFFSKRFVVLTAHTQRNLSVQLSQPHTIQVHTTKSHGSHFKSVFFKATLSPALRTEPTLLRRHEISHQFTMADKIAHKLNIVKTMLQPKMFKLSVNFIFISVLISCYMG